MLGMDTLPGACLDKFREILAERMSAEIPDDTG
jgi:hypothetical protein